MTNALVEATFTYITTKQEMTLNKIKIGDIHYKKRNSHGPNSTISHYIYNSKGKLPSMTLGLMFLTKQCNLLPGRPLYSCLCHVR